MMHADPHGYSESLYNDKDRRIGPMMEFDPGTLAEFDGSNGKPVYVAYEGRVYDVSKSKLWKGGVHQKRHHAGEDLTEDIEAAPHKFDLLGRFPQVGILTKSTAVKITR
jgi:predicted heme/steroid binding protein